MKTSKELADLSSSNFKALLRMVDAIETLTEWRAFESIFTATDLDDEERRWVRRAWMRRRATIEGGDDHDEYLGNFDASDFLKAIESATNSSLLCELERLAFERHKIGLLSEHEIKEIVDAVETRQSCLIQQKAAFSSDVLNLLKTVEECDEYIAEIDARADSGEITTREKDAAIKAISAARERLAQTAPRSACEF